MKALAIGFPKTGTSTLFHALRKAGIEAAHQHHQDSGFGPAMLSAYAQGLDPMAAEPMCRYDAATQLDFVNARCNYWGQLCYGMLRDIRARHPDLVFILQTRRVEDTIRSMTNWQDFRALLERHEIPGLPAGTGGRDADLRAWIETHYATCKRMFAGDPNFVTFDIADPEAPKVLGKALGRELPWWGRIRPEPAR